MFEIVLHLILTSPVADPGRRSFWDVFGDSCDFSFSDLRGFT